MSDRSTRSPAQTPARRFKNAIYERFARVSKALASPRRIDDAALKLLSVAKKNPEVVLG